MYWSAVQRLKKMPAPTVEATAGKVRRTNRRKIAVSERRRAAAGHHAAEAHGADDEPHGVEHPGHAARRNQLVQHGRARSERRRAEEGHQHPLESGEEVGLRDARHLRHQPPAAPRASPRRRRPPRRRASRSPGSSRAMRPPWPAAREAATARCGTSHGAHRRKAPSVPPCRGRATVPPRRRPRAPRASTARWCRACSGCA